MHKNDPICLIRFNISSGKKQSRLIDLNLANINIQPVYSIIPDRRKTESLISVIHAPGAFSNFENNKKRVTKH
jgi:hypothetical protein